MVSIYFCHVSVNFTASQPHGRLHHITDRPGWHWWMKEPWFLWDLGTCTGSIFLPALPAAQIACGSTDDSIFHHSSVVQQFVVHISKAGRVFSIVLTLMRGDPYVHWRRGEERSPRGGCGTISNWTVVDPCCRVKRRQAGSCSLPLVTALWCSWGCLRKDACVINALESEGNAGVQCHKHCEVK